jgi:hypothetical protein
LIVSDFTALFQSLENSSVLGDRSYLEIVQDVIDQIFSHESFARLYRPPPDVTTIDAQLAYTFEELFTSFVASSVTTIRKVRGLWKPALSDNNLTDYGRQGYPYFDQDDINRRVYDYDVYVDNERKTVNFASNPGTTTDTWKADFYLKAPRIALTDEIPLLFGWEKRLLIPGCRAWFEELDKGEPGVQARLFEAVILRYRDALERHQKLDNYTAAEGFKVNIPNVVPQ